MTSIVSPLTSAPATTDNRLIYVLWIAGFLGTAVVAVMGARQIPISERDFVSVWVAGKMAASGHAAQIYDVRLLRAASAAYAGTTFKIAFPYPPHILLICIPLSFLPLTVSFFVWQAVSAILFIVAAKPYRPTGMPRVLSVMTPSAIVSMSYGQNGLFLGALWLFTFSGSAIAAALLTIKPHLGFLAAPEVLRRKMLAKTVIIVSALLISSVKLFGFDTWKASVVGAAAGQFHLISSGQYPNWYAQMTTPYLGYGVVGWIVFAMAAGVLLLRRFDVFTAAIATFLIAPYGFHYDMTVVCLGVGIFLYRYWRSLPPWQTLVCGLAFLSPVIVRAGTWLVPPILLCSLYVLSSSRIRTPVTSKVKPAPST